MEEGVPLTPSMLMHGFNLTDLPSHSKSGMERSKERIREKYEKLTPKERYYMIENVKDSFWNRFSSQVITELHERHFRQAKAHPTSIRFPKVGDICLLRQEITPRRHWPLAVVESVEVSQRDGKIRTVSVRTLWFYLLGEGAYVRLDSRS